MKLFPFAWGTATPKKSQGAKARTARPVGPGQRQPPSLGPASRPPQIYQQQPQYQQPQYQQPQYQQPAPPAAAPAGGSNIADEIQRLASLKEQGILSDDEFAAAKAKLLGI